MPKRLSARQGDLKERYDRELKPLIQPLMRQGATTAEGRKVIAYLRGLVPEDHVTLVAYAQTQLSGPAFEKLSTALTPLLKRPRLRLVSQPAGA
ncbi:MAG: hypothetical protein WAV50_01000 [Minisyncoccia bacterium]